MKLSDFGWDSDWERQFEALRAEGLVPARVTLEHNHVYRVFSEAGELLAESAGRVKHRAEGRQGLPAVGDWVAVRPPAAGSRAQIRFVLPRRTWFSRKAAGRETTEQVIAANVDVVLLVFGLDKGVNVRAIERYLVVARQSRATPVVVLNKADLSEDLAGDLAEATASVGEAAVYGVSARTGAGFESLERLATPGCTLALLGPSGAGKSSVVNRLVGREALPTGEVRDWDARGRHTSVHRQLVARAAGGVIIDTPGMREVQLWDTAPIAESFSDVQALAKGCRFRDCRHDREPGCEVRAAVEAGRLDGSRYESYLKLQGEQHDLARLRDVRSQIEARRAGKIGARAMRALQKDRER